MQLLHLCWGPPSYSGSIVSLVIISVVFHILYGHPCPQFGLLCCCSRTRICAVIALWSLTFLSAPLCLAVSLDMPTLVAVVAFYVFLGLLFGGVCSEGFIFSIFLVASELVQLILVEDIHLEGI